MTFKKKAAAASKAEEPAAPALGPDGFPIRENPLDLSELRKPQPPRISTNRLFRHINTDEIKKPDLSSAGARMPGCRPLTTEEMHHGLSPIDFLAKNANADELRLFRAAVLARMTREGKTLWRTLPSGGRVRADHKLWGCPACGAWMWLPPSATFCPICNMGARLDHPGQVRLATPEEEKAWTVREEKAIADYKRHVFNLRNEERRKSGLEPYTFEQYEAEQKREGEAARKSYEALNRISAANVREL